MPRYVPLSDGEHFSTIPDGTSDADAQTMVGADQSKLDNYYQTQATQTGKPVTAGSNIYNGYEVIPNSAVGRGVSWAEQNVPGYDWLNRHLPQPDPASMRIAIQTVAGIPDFGSATYNVVKHNVTPGAGTDYDAPYAGAAIREQLGVPALPANASKTEQIAEAVIPALITGGAAGGNMLSLGNLATATARGTGSVYGSDWGGQIGGETGSYLGSLIGGGGIPFKQGAAKLFGGSLASENAPTIQTATEASRPTEPGGNFQGVSTPSPAGTPDYSQFTPSFKTLANPLGQRIASTMGSLPYAGAPIEGANEATRGFVQAARDAAATDATGPGGLPPGGASPATIGPVLTEGAQSALIKIVQDMKDRQNLMDNAMRGYEVPTASIINEGANQVAGNARGDTATAATLDRTGQLQGVAPGGAKYARGDVPLPAMPTAPWSYLGDWVGELNASLQKSGRPALPDDIAAALKTVANQEREKAAEAVQPGGGAQFRLNNESYARSLDDVDRLMKLSGNPLGVSGKFTDVPGEATVAKQLTGNMQSPSNLDIFSHPAFPTDARLNAVGQYISTLGNADQGTFRPEHFARDYDASKEGLNTLLHGPSGAPLGSQDLLSNAATIGRNFVTPMSRHGLMSQIGTGASVGKALDVVSKVFENILPWKPAQYLGVPQLARGFSSWLESDAMKRAMTGRPQDWSTPVRNATITGTVGDQDQYKRLRQSPAMRRPPGSTP